jgi:hypothetical protein
MVYPDTGISGAEYNSYNNNYNSNYNNNLSKTSVSIPSPILQLAACGAMDKYLIGNPMITYWKVNYNRHTNFAIESIEQSYSNPIFGSLNNNQLVNNNKITIKYCVTKIENSDIKEYIKNNYIEIFSGLFKILF